jgi:hypothetical protein
MDRHMRPSRAVSLVLSTTAAPPVPVAAWSNGGAVTLREVPNTDIFVDAADGLQYRLIRTGLNESDAGSSSG